MNLRPKARDHMQSSGAGTSRPISQEARLGKLLRSTKPAISVAGLAGLYFLAWGPLLLSVDGVWWDDWLLVESSASAAGRYNQAGQPWVGALHVLVAPIGPVGYHIISWLLYFLTGLALWGILGTLSSLHGHERFFIVALFLVLPLNAARNTMNTFQYSVSIFLFFLAWYLLVRRARPKPLELALAGVAFYASFTMSSLLVFYAVPIAHLGWRSVAREGISLMQFARSKFPLLALPFLFFTMKTLWFAPFGLYDGYNSLDVRGLAAGSLTVLLAGLPFGVVLSAGSSLSKHANHLWLLTFGGLLLVALAVFPYIAVGHQLPFSGWLSRDQILIPLGTAVTLLALVKLIAWRVGRRFAAVFALLTLVTSISLSARVGHNYWLDWRKQQAVITAFEHDDTLRDSTLVVFIDETTDQNIFNDDYRFYAWNCMMKRAYGGDGRLGLNAGVDLVPYLNGQYESYYGGSSELDYCASGYREPVVATVARISASSQPGEFVISTTRVSTSDLASLVSPTL